MKLFFKFFAIGEAYVQQWTGWADDDDDNIFLRVYCPLCTHKVAENWWRGSLEPGDRHRILYFI